MVFETVSRPVSPAFSSPALSAASVPLVRSQAVTERPLAGNPVNDMLNSDVEWRSFLGSDDESPGNFKLPQLTGHSTKLDNKQLVDVLNESCEGFTIVTVRSRQSKNTFDFGCNRGGNYRNRAGRVRQRQTSTCKIGCKWLMTGHRNGPYWDLRVKHGEHDYQDEEGRPVVHAPEEDARSSSLKRVRLLSQVDLSYIEEQFYANVQPFKIMTLLHSRFEQTDRQFPLIKRDLYNLRQEYNQKQLSSGTAIQTLADRLQSDPSFHHRINKDDSNRLTHLIFLKKSCIDLFKQHHDVLLLDCTYKTNRYKMPLLNMAFVTSLHTTMNLGFGFMIRERESDYM